MDLLKIRLLVSFIILFSLNVFANELITTYTKDFKNLSKEQIEVAKAIYHKAKVYDLGYTAAAIAWQESNLGMYPVNLQDPSCGPFHINIKTYTTRYKIPKGNFNFNKACSLLISDLDVSLTAFLAEIEAWKVVHRKKTNLWEYVYRSYNAGYNFESNRAINYSNQIKARIKVLMKHL